ncbi:MAG: hypothetical protein H0V44_12105 [Planctomycetes bacterium]|nr:hypothetical protein [Planctomycetota bacterium]
MEEERTDRAISGWLRITAVVILSSVTLVSIVVIGITVARSLRGLDQRLQGYDGQNAEAAAGPDDSTERAPALRGSAAPKDEP